MTVPITLTEFVAIALGPIGGGRWAGQSAILVRAYVDVCNCLHDRRDEPEPATAEALIELMRSASWRSGWIGKRNECRMRNLWRDFEDARAALAELRAGTA